MSDRSGSFELWIAGADGTDPRRLTDSGAAVVGSPRMPNLPSLTGVPIYAQVLLIQDPLGAFLTNWTLDRIMP